MMALSSQDSSVAIYLLKGSSEFQLMLVLCMLLKLYGILVMVIEHFKLLLHK